MNDLNYSNGNVISLQDKHIVLESDAIRAVIDPESGGRIRSFLSKRTGREFLYQDPRKKFRGLGFSDNDISGYCECFPTVARCEYPDGSRHGMDMGDHGWLWQEPWQAAIDGDKVVMSKSVQQFDCLFQRVAHQESNNKLRLDYTIRNDGVEPFKYIYSAHPLLYGGEHTRLELPEEMKEAFVYVSINVPGLADKTWIKWPQPHATTLNGPYSGDRESVVKLFSNRLSNGRAAVCHTDVGESIRIEFDISAVPYLGVLISQGYYGTHTGLKRSVFLGLEPTNGVGDDLPTCASTKTLQQIEPGQELTFWILLAMT
ncbi:MAG: hypothetical protein HYX78_09725 [Armatimonadetes bacterium]|nr:hypothetical protein [Armatimonadota bacterium]